MSLRWKMVLFFSIVFALFILMAQSVMQGAVMPGFARLERQEAVKDILRCQDAMNREVHSLGLFVRTWSAWDDAYQYAADHNAEFIKSNCPPETYTNNNLNLIWISRPDGKLIWGETRNDHGQLLDIADVNPQILNASSPLIKFNGGLDMTGGFINTSRGPMLIVSRPIVTSHNEGPIRRAIIMGRLYLADEMQQLNEQTHVSLQVWPARADQVPAEDVRYLNARPGETQLAEVSDGLLRVYLVMNDIYGHPALLLARMFRGKSRSTGDQAARAALYLSIVGAAAILLAGWLMTQIAVVRPLRQMARHMMAVAARDDLKRKLNLTRRDEIGLLGQQFDMMVTSLAESRARGMETAHRTGMLDIATDVLHNVGNALNTVNVSVEVLDERMRASKLPGLAKTVELLKEHRTDLAAFLITDARGTKIVDYLADLSDVLSDEQKQSIGDLQRMKEKVEHIRAIIATQLKHANMATFTESEEFESVMEAVLIMNSEAIGRKKITVTREFSGAHGHPHEQGEVHAGDEQPGSERD